MKTTFLVKGAHFRGREVKELSNSLEVGTKVKIKRDAENQHDEYACSVHYDDIHIGFVEKDAAFGVAYFFDEEGYIEIEGTITGREQGSRVSYPVVEIETGDGA